MHSEKENLTLCIHKEATHTAHNTVGEHRCCVN